MTDKQMLKNNYLYRPIQDIHTRTQVRHRLSELLCFEQMQQNDLHVPE